MLASRMNTPQATVAFFRDQPKLSMQQAMMFSNTASTVVKLAKVRNRKNNAPHSRPPAMLTNTRGRVRKIREGPLSASMPKLKQAGKMIMPDMKATKVSRQQIRTASPGRRLASDM